MVEADPVAARVRDIMAERTQWTGQASDLLREGRAGTRIHSDQRVARKSLTASPSAPSAP
jgi:hypothetical protein